MAAKIRYKKEQAAWYVVINYQGNRWSGKMDTQFDAEKAAELINQKIRQIKLGILDESELEKIFGRKKIQDPVTPTLSEYYNSKSIKAYLEGGLQPRTRNIYKNAFETHILPQFGQTPLDAITRDDVKGFVAAMMQKTFPKKEKRNGKIVVVQKKRTRSTLRINFSCFAAIMNHAREDGWIRDNPANRLSKFYKQAPTGRTEVQFLTKEEVVVFLEAVLKHAPEFYPVFLLAIHTGLRRGEIAALRWSDVDWNGKFLVVRHSTKGNGDIGKTKTGKIHKVDLSDALYEELKALHQKRKSQFLRRRRGMPEWIFCNREGKQIDVHNLRNRVFYKCLRLAGLRRMRFHDLRHTFASLLISQGESLAYVKDQLGHSSIKMTVDVYGHLVPGSNRQAVNKLPAITKSTGSNVIRLKKTRRA